MLTNRITSQVRIFVTSHVSSLLGIMLRAQGAVNVLNSLKVSSC